VKLFDRFFRDEEDDRQQEVLSEAHSLLKWASEPYFPVFLGFLEREAAKPLVVGDHMELVKQAVRANTLREIRADLLRKVNLAQAAIAQTREDGDG